MEKPLDQTLIGDGNTEYDIARPLYRCAICQKEGELSLHKYVDECPFFEDAIQA